MRRELLEKRIALERITKLIELALERSKDNTGASELLGKRYVALAKKMSSHYKVSIPERLDDLLCKKCGNAMVPGINCTVRVSRSVMIYRCRCGRENRMFPKRAISDPASREA
jgi:RNase P subunit RPR2